MAKLSIGLIGFLFLSLAKAQFSAPTTDQVNAIKELVQHGLKHSSDLLPTCVRLGFHDCVGDACDGCINLDNASNNGLADVIDFLEEIYADSSVRSVMSRADFWQLAANAATELGIKWSNRAGKTDKMPTSPMVFRWGRSDCANSPSTYETHVFPPATMSRPEMMKYFDTNYGFNENEVTALMGAHTLGNADKEASGYKGAWIEGQTTKFNTVYYKYLAGRGHGVVFENSASDKRDSDSDGDRKWQWQMEDSEGERLGMMLNTDMELYYNIDVDSDKGTSCSIVATDELPAAACSKADTSSLVELYAANTTAFWEAYKSVYDKLSSHGYTSLEEVDLS